MEYRGLSLFANVGIGETYLKDIGYPIVLANELLKDRCRFYQHLNPNHQIIPGDINNLKIFSEIIETAKNLNVNFILATPPCQGMSLLGKQEHYDPRNLLITKVIKAVEELNPEFILIENVPQMYKTYIDAYGTGETITIQDYSKKEALRLGYKIKFDIFNAADYGTPQNRSRAFTRIYKKHYYWQDPPKQKIITVREAIGDLPSLENGEKSNIKYHNAKEHNKNEILWLSHTPTGQTARNNDTHHPKVHRKSNDGNIITEKMGGFHSTYSRIAWDKPAPAITMNNGSMGGQENVHPGRLLPDGTYSDARVLTHLELFRLMGLPDNWNIPEWASDSMIRKVIGEAIPPILTKEILKTIELL
jgi:DNA (cytosine-5)-methyltransferase 1